MKIKSIMLAGCATGIALGQAGAALAQDAAAVPARGASSAAATPDQGIGDIVVTARRVEEKLQDIPVAVSALSGAQLTQQGIREVRDLNASVPNLSVQQGNGGAGAAVFTIRGQSLSNVLLTIDPAVGIYVDGVNYSRAYGLRAALVDIARVEVLRGPQGTLYGKNTTGGAVSIYTADPNDKLGLRVEGTAGNYNAYSLGATLNLPIAENLAARFVVNRSAHRGYYKSNVTSQRMAKDDSWYGRGKLKYTGDTITATLSADFTDLDQGGIPNVFRGASAFNTATNNDLVEVAIETGIAPNAISNAPITGATADALIAKGLNPANYALTANQRTAALAALKAQASNDFYRTNSGYPNAQSKYRGQSASLDLSWEISDYFTARSITGYRHFKTVTGTDNDATAFTLNEAYSPTTDDFFSQEVQLLGGNKKLNWVTGLYYSYEDGDLNEYSRSTPGIQINRAKLGLSSTPATLSSATITSKSLGAFGQANWHITDQLTFTGGARITKEIKRGTVRNGTFSGILNPGLTDGPFGAFACSIGKGGVILPANACSRTDSDSFSKPSFLASLDYKFTPDILGYAKFARSFKGGGRQARAAGVNEVNYAAFAPEIVTEYEVGAKSELFDRRVRLNVAAFWDDYKDIQKNIFVLPPVTVVQNAAAATIKGVEAELTIRATEALTLTANGGYLHAKYSKNAGTFVGLPFATPDWNYTLGARYVQPTSVGDASLNVNWQWQDDFALIPESPEYKLNASQKAYGLLSARLGINIDEWDAEVAVFGRNLTDKKYYTAAVGIQALGHAVSVGGEPRTFGVQFIKRFGEFR